MLVKVEERKRYFISNLLDYNLFILFFWISLEINCFFQKPAKKESKKESSSVKASTSKKKSRDGDEDGKKKKQKKKKDPNAPKRAMSGFIFFSQMERDVGSFLL